MSNDTITILNKLKSSDNNNQGDVWVKTVLKNCKWKNKSVSTVNGTSVSISNKITVLIPFGRYIPYWDWKNDITKGYTMSENDVIMLGTVTEDVTSQNITAIKKLYPTCNVRSIDVCEYMGFNKVQIAIEGV